MSDYDLIAGDDWLSAAHEIAGLPFAGERPGEESIVGLLDRQAARWPDRPFLSDLLPDGSTQTLTFMQAAEAVARRAAALRACGLQRGERVGLLGRNAVAFALNVLAVLESGGVAVLLSHLDPPARVAAQSAFVGTRFLLHDSEASAVAAQCSSVEKALTFDSLAAQAALSAPAPPAVPPRSTDAALILFTSGTTGVPKAVVQSHRNVACHAHSVAAHHRLGPGVRLLCVLPLYHVNGLEFTIFSVLAGGSHTFISRGFDGLGFWSLLRRHQIHIASLVPHLLRLLAERAPLPGDEPLPLRYAVSAAAPLSTDLAHRVWDLWRLRIVQGYGLSEATNFTCLMPSDSSAAAYERWMLDGRRPSIGPVLPYQQVEVHGPTGPLGPGEEGEIVIRGHCVMSGYLHNPEATAEALRSGWFHSGDRGYWLPGDDGRPYLQVAGRLREIAKRGGSMVSLLEIDDLLARLPGVRDAAAVAFANRWVDEEIGAVVVPVLDADFQVDDLLAACRQVLPFAAMPKVVEVVSEIPRTGSGKIRRGDLAARFSGYHERLFVERSPTNAPHGEAN